MFTAMNMVMSMTITIHIAVLTYMYQHNQSHAAELDQMAGKLQQEGMDKAAEQIRRAVDEFQKGNMYLNLALAMVKDGKQEG